MNSKLVKHSDDKEGVDPTQSAVGSLIYSSTSTRPDIVYTVNKVVRFCAKPTKHQWTAVKLSLNLGLLYSKEKPKECIGFSDAQWAGDQDDRKSVTGYMFRISGAAVSWRSKTHV